MSKGSKVLSCLGVGCLVLLVAGVASGYYVWIKKDEWARRAAAFTAEKMFEGVVDGLNIPEKEKKAVMKPVRAFAQEIREGKVSMEQGTAVMQALVKGPLVVILMLRAFETKYLEPSALSEEEKENARVQISRYAHGLVTEKIPQKETDKISAIVAVTTADSHGNTKKTLKESLSDEEVRQCLKIMKTATAEAGIPEREFKFDVTKEIQKAIAKGMAGGKAGASSAKGNPVPAPAP